MIRCQRMQAKIENGQYITSSKTGQLFLPHHEMSLRAHTFSDTELGTSLLSISELCNNGCIAFFTRDNVHVTKDGNTVLNSKKTFSDVLRHANFPAGEDPVAGSKVLRSNTDEAFTRFIHTSFGSPVLSTFLLEVRKEFLAAYPRLTPAMVTAYLSLTAATARGHLDQHKQGQDSTASEELDEDDITTDSKPKQIRTAYTKSFHSLTSRIRT